MVALVSPQPSMCHVLLLTNPLCSTREHFPVQRAFPRDSHLLLGRRDVWLILQWGQGKLLQALENLGLSDLSTS